MDNRRINLTLTPTEGEGRVVHVNGTADSMLSKVKGSWYVDDDRRTTAAFEMTTNHPYDVTNLSIAIEGQQKMVYDQEAKIVIDNEGNIFFTFSNEDEEQELLNFDICASTGAFLEFFILKKDVQFIRGR